jgi:SAM-dependent methyltransferase
LNSARILDVGCGPGSWCIDLSTKYPRIEVIGVDSDDMFPSQRNLPSNCQLLVCNVLNGLKEFPDASFDVIHIRFMVLSFTTVQYPQVVKDCWRLLKPGGYIEILETNLAVYSPGPITKKLNEESKSIVLDPSMFINVFLYIVMQVASSRGMNPKDQVDNLSQLLPTDAINQQAKYRSIPIGVWGGRIGVLCRDDMIHLLTRFQPAVKDYYGRSTNEFDQEITTVFREMDHYRSFSNYYFYAAQKPYQQQPLKRQFTTASFNPKTF